MNKKNNPLTDDRVFWQEKGNKIGGKKILRKCWWAGAQWFTERDSIYIFNNARRPGLKRALRRLRAGDVLVVWKLDRLGRSVRDLITLVSELQARGVNFRSLTDSIDTSTPAGRFFFHVMSALAEMERELIVERTRAGLAAAREQGRIGGRRRIMTTEVVERCRQMLVNGASRQQVSAVIGVDVKTIYRYCPASEVIVDKK